MAEHQTAPLMDYHAAIAGLDPEALVRRRCRAGPHHRDGGRRGVAGEAQQQGRTEPVRGRAMMSNREPLDDVDWLAVVDALEAQAIDDRGPGEMLEGPTREAFLDLRPYAGILAEAAAERGGASDSTA